MKLIAFTVAIISLLLFAPESNVHAQAQKLCVKNKLKVNKKNRVNNRRLLTTAETCPRGRTEILDTSAFAGEDGANGQNGTNGQDGTSPFYSIYEDITLTTSNTSSSSTLASVEEFEEFTKQQDGTYLKVTFTSSVFILNDGDNSGGANLQVRMNGLDSSNNGSSSYDRELSGSFTVYDQSLGSNDDVTKTFTIIGIFNGLSAGTYTPSLWLATNDATQAIVNAGSRSAQTLVIEEVELRS